VRSLRVRHSAAETSWNVCPRRGRSDTVSGKLKSDLAHLQRCTRNSTNCVKLQCATHCRRLHLEDKCSGKQPAKWRVSHSGNYFAAEMEGAPPFALALGPTAILEASLAYLDLRPRSGPTVRPSSRRKAKRLENTPHLQTLRRAVGCTHPVARDRAIDAIILLHSHADAPRSPERGPLHRPTQASEPRRSLLAGRVCTCQRQGDSTESYEPPPKVSRPGTVPKDTRNM